MTEDRERKHYVRFLIIGMIAKLIAIDRYYVWNDSFNQHQLDELATAVMELPDDVAGRFNVRELPF